MWPGISTQGLPSLGHNDWSKGWTCDPNRVNQTLLLEFYTRIVLLFLDSLSWYNLNPEMAKTIYFLLQALSSPDEQESSPTPIEKQLEEMESLRAIRVQDWSFHLMGWVGGKNIYLGFWVAVRKRHYGPCSTWSLNEHVTKQYDSRII